LAVKVRAKSAWRRRSDPAIMTRSSATDTDPIASQGELGSVQAHWSTALD
jgi:hypothetical protein